MDTVEKNQLIAKQVPEKRSWFKRNIPAVVGIVFFVAGLIWTFIVIYTFFVYLMKLGQGGLDVWARFYEAWGNLIRLDKENLEIWSKFGDATSGSIALAALGTIIISFRYVILQLESQQNIEKTRFQPIVLCSALLDHRVEGTDSAEKVRIVKPSLKLRIQNIGDSPAMFVQMEIVRCDLITTTGASEPLYAKIKNRKRSIDKLINNDRENVDLYVDTLITQDLPSSIDGLIYDILDGEVHNDIDRLELEVVISHKNIMGVEYRRQGTFIWSEALRSIENSEFQQLEYLEEFRIARRNPSNKKTIGQFVRHNMPLHATVRVQTP